MNEGFCATLTKKLEYYNEHRSDPKIEKIKEEAKEILNL